jgi:sRNA-binding protein
MIYEKNNQKTKGIQRKNKQALVVGAERVDLEGIVRSTVTEKEVAFLKAKEAQSNKIDS